MYGFEAPYQKMFDVVNTISASGGGLPTEKAVNALKNAGYRWARVKQNRTGGYCGSDIDLSLLNEGKQVKLIDLCTFWSSSRINIISITQHAPEVTGGDFIFLQSVNHNIWNVCNVCIKKFR